MSLRAPQQQIKRPTSVSKTNGSSLNPERRSVAGNQNLPRRFPTSVARLVFHQLFRSTGRFRDSIARQPNLWPGIQVFAHTIDLQAAKQMPFMRY
jgi:hypothetical protein